MSPARSKLGHVAGRHRQHASEVAVKALYGLEEPALIDMGDFVGGMLKYLRRHPVERVTVAGGVAKMTKLAQGLLDLHSKRGEIDRAWLGTAGARGRRRGRVWRETIHHCNTAAEAFDSGARPPASTLGSAVAEGARRTASACLGRAEGLDVVLFDRTGRLVARAGSGEHR